MAPAGEGAHTLRADGHPAGRTPHLPAGPLTDTRTPALLPLPPLDEIGQVVADLNARHASGEWVYAERTAFNTTYAWAVPHPLAIQAIVASAGLRTIVEIGAGTGLWAGYLAAAGAHVEAWDATPVGPGSHYHRTARGTYHPVGIGSVEVLAGHVDPVLMLCWPPHRGRLAAEALAAHPGDLLISIGERRGGSTADHDFFDALDAGWDCTLELPQPNFFGVHSRLTTWVRRSA